MFVSAVDLLGRASSLRSPLHRVEIEVQDLEVLRQVLQAPPDIIMLDNMGREALIQALKLIGGRAEVEVSVGVCL